MQSDCAMCSFHDYQGINLPRIWTIVEEDIPPLLEALNSYLNEID